MEHRFFDNPAFTKVLDHDPLEERRCHPRVPDGVGIHDDDGAARANSEARCFSAFDPRRTEQQAFALQESRQHRVQIPPSAVRGAEPSGTHEDVARIALHEWLPLHARYLSDVMPERVTIGGLNALVSAPAVETGPPLLFVHGYFGLAIAFERMMERLSSNGHRCVAIDLRGHGDSALSGYLGRVSIHDYADDVDRVARLLGDPVVIGHSMGGLLAQLVAERGVAKGIVLLSPAPPRGIPVLSLKLAIHQAKYMPAILTSRIVVPGRSDIRALVLNRVPESERDMLLDLLVPDSGRAALQMSVLGVPVDRKRVKAPVLVIAGDQDLFIPASRGRRVAARYGAPFLSAPGRGHMLIIEPGYEELCSWIGDWIASTFPAGQRGAA